ncbi:MAG: HlyD family efflux transporter periplasmic adaptor subunit [Steroidobacteraceae bacterium]
MRGTLFRQQALDHQRPALIGNALAVQPLSFKVLSVAAVGMATAVILFGCFGEYTRKARVSGYLAPSTGLIKVYAPTAGTLIEKHVTEGQQVRKGDTLFVLSTERASSTTPAAQATAIEQTRERLAHVRRERDAQVRIEAAEAGIRRGRVQSMIVELQQLEAGMAVQKQRAQSARSTASRYKEFFARQLVTSLQVEQTEADMLDQQGRLHELERSHTALQRELTTLQRELTAAELGATQRVSELDRQVLTLEQELTESESRRVLVITAPADGTVTAILSDRGLTANPQTPLLSILPRDAQLQARLLVPSRAIGSLAVGAVVRVRYQAFPYQRYGSFAGSITEISRTLLAPAELDGPVAANEPVYRVTVALERQNVTAGRASLPLQAGMQLDADVLLARRRLLAWVFEPLLGVTRKA